MDNFNNIVSANLVRLRKSRKLTQAELAESIHYSDKSVSKWENGEACPSLEVALTIVRFYGISLDDLVDENLEIEETSSEKPHNYSYLVITLLACSVVWLVSTVAFIYGIIFSVEHPWLSFLYAVPLTCIVLLIFNSLWGKRRLNYAIISVFVWTLLTVLFVYTYVIMLAGRGMWVIFILGIPIQISIILWSQLKHPLSRRKMSRKSDKEQ